jgi:hypothetical protein
MGVTVPTLIVRRDKGWADKVRKYRILLDGADIGAIGEGEELRKEIAAGTHEVQARIDWCGSRRLKIEAHANDIAVQVSSALRGWRLFLASFYVLFRRNDYLRIDLSP